jgi:hypothetical protein
VEVCLTCESLFTSSFLAVRQLSHEADDPFPCSAEVKNEWSYTHIPLVCLHGMESDIFTFLTVDILNYGHLSGKYYNTVAYLCII